MVSAARARNPSDGQREEAIGVNAIRPNAEFLTLTSLPPPLPLQVLAVARETAAAVEYDFKTVSDPMTMSAALQGATLQSYVALPGGNFTLLQPLASYDEFAFVDGYQPASDQPPDYGPLDGRSRLSNMSGSVDFSSVYYFNSSTGAAVQNRTALAAAERAMPAIRGAVDASSLLDRDFRVTYFQGPNTTVMYYHSVQITPRGGDAYFSIHRTFPGIVKDNAAYDPPQRGWFRHAPLGAVYMYGPYVETFTRETVVTLSSKQRLQLGSFASVTVVGTAVMLLRDVARIVSRVQYLASGYAALVKNDPQAAYPVVAFPRGDPLDTTTETFKPINHPDMLGSTFPVAKLSGDGDGSVFDYTDGEGEDWFVAQVRMLLCLGGGGLGYRGSDAGSRGSVGPLEEAGMAKDGGGHGGRSPNPRGVSAKHLFSPTPPSPSANPRRAQVPCFPIVDGETGAGGDALILLVLAKKSEATATLPDLYDLVDDTEAEGQRIVLIGGAIVFVLITSVLFAVATAIARPLVQLQRSSERIIAIATQEVRDYSQLLSSIEAPQWVYDEASHLQSLFRGMVVKLQDAEEQKRVRRPFPQNPFYGARVETHGNLSVVAWSEKALAGGPCAEEEEPQALPEGVQVKLLSKPPRLPCSLWMQLMPVGVFLVAALVAIMVYFLSVVSREGRSWMDATGDLIEESELLTLEDIAENKADFIESFFASARIDVLVFSHFMTGLLSKQLLPSPARALTSFSLDPYNPYAAPVATSRRFSGYFTRLSEGCSGSSCDLYHNANDTELSSLLDVKFPSTYHNNSILDFVQIGQLLQPQGQGGRETRRGGGGGGGGR